MRWAFRTLGVACWTLAISPLALAQSPEAEPSGWSTILVVLLGLICLGVIHWRRVRSRGFRMPDFLWPKSREAQAPSAPSMEDAGASPDTLEREVRKPTPLAAGRASPQRGRQSGGEGS